MSYKDSYTTVGSDQSFRQDKRQLLSLAAVTQDVTLKKKRDAGFDSHILNLT